MYIIFGRSIEFGTSDFAESKIAKEDKMIAKEMNFFMFEVE